MILVLAFATWSLLLTVVGVMTGMAVLTSTAAALAGVSVACALLVLIVELRNPEPISSRGYEVGRRGTSASAAY